MPWENVPMFGDGTIVPCPVCHFPNRMHFRDNKWLDHYSPVLDNSELAQENMARNDTRTERLMRRARSGKKTVALVGWAPASCAKAPYDEPNVKLGGDLEIWGLNQAHVMPWMKKWTRWFQLHKEKSFKRELSLTRGLAGHYDWLKQDHKQPIYMQFQHEEIPNSVEYPLTEIVEEFLGKFLKGSEVDKYFTNSLAFMMALALYEDKVAKHGFDRIEVYGFEMADDTEYVKQKGCAEFWIGIALGRGKEVFLPEGNSLASGPLYAYQGEGASNVLV